MITNPDLAVALFKARHRDLLKDAETARLLNEARAHRPRRRGRLLGIGGLRFLFGMRSTQSVAARHYVLASDEAPQLSRASGHRTDIVLHADVAKAIARA